MIQELQQTEKPDIIIAATHMGHYDNGEHGSNAPGDVEMARALPARSLAMIVGGHSQDPVCMAAENKKQVDYVPGTPCKPDQQTASGLCRRMSGANTWDGLILSFVMAK